MTFINFMSQGSCHPNNEHQTFYVDINGGQDFTSIQEAINASIENTTIHVNNGIYNGEIFITKPLKLIGKDKNLTIINGINSSNVIDISGAKSLSVYPNPAKSVFTMDLYSDAVGEAVVSLYNSTGMKALEYRTEKKETWLNCEIPLGNLNDGIYMIEVIVNNEEINYTRLIVIE